MADRLETYRQKRDFTRTQEPSGEQSLPEGRRYLIQKHAATRLHYDLRLETGGVLKSWAVTRGPSLNPQDKRLAVEVEDHPVSYGRFEGTIPKGQYGGGTVMLWDEGTWEPLGDPDEGLKEGNLKFRLHGQRLQGEWALVRMKPRAQDCNRKGEVRHNWLLIKHKDAFARDEVAEKWLEDNAFSVISGRRMDDIAANLKPPHERAVKTEAKTVSKTSKAALAFVPPALATLSLEIPKGHNWLHEIKFDGYRIQALIKGDDVRLMTRTGLDWTARFAPLPDQLKALKVTSAILDGEVVAVNAEGQPDFKTLQAALSGEINAPLQYYVFDLLHLDGKDIRDLPLKARKAQLRPIIEGAETDNHINYSDHFDISGANFQKTICGLDMEGIISKRADAPYRSGRGRDWLKIKCHRRQEFVIGGYTLPTKGGRGIGALLVGFYEDGQLIYAGKVGTGFTQTASLRLRQQLEALPVDASPFADVPAAFRRGARWVEPRLVAEVQFANWTSEGRMRHPSFQGLREDKPAAVIGRELPSPEGKAVVNAPQKGKTSMSKNAKAEIGGIAISNPQRIVYPDIGLTKLEVAEYYYSVASVLLPHVAGRPISVIRCPEGMAEDCFFQRHLAGASIPHIHDTGIKVTGRSDGYVMIEDAAGLISLSQWGVLEIHPWGCMAEAPDLPDRIVFDLDPDEVVDWAKVVTAAREVRLRMQEFGLKSFVKTTGGKGLHVVIPIKPEHGWDNIKAFSKAIAQSMEHDAPDIYIARASKAARKGKIFVDYLRNDHTATAVAPYVVRARDGAPVATPVEWDELSETLTPADFNVRTMAARLKAVKGDIWADMLTVKQSLSDKILRALNIGD